MVWNNLPGALRAVRLSAGLDLSAVRLSAGRLAAAGLGLSLGLGLGLIGVSACGGGGTEDSSPSLPSQETQDETIQTDRIRLAVPARDPVWDWSKSMGPVVAWRSTSDIDLDVSSPPNRFAALAGGHVDVAVINSLDVAQLAERTDFDPVIIGKHSTDETFLGVSRASPARDIRDLSGGSIAVDGEFGATLLWGTIAHDLYGLNFHTDSSDFEVTIAEPASLAGLVVSGAVDACVCRPQFSAQYLHDERLRPLYDGRTGARVYLDELAVGPRREPMALALVTSREWYSNNISAVAELVSLWEAVLEDWRLNIEHVVIEYPNLFSVETDEQIDWVIDYIIENDWFHQSAHLDANDARVYLDMTSRMQRIGLISPDARAADIQFVPRQPITS